MLVNHHCMLPQKQEQQSPYSPSTSSSRQLSPTAVQDEDEHSDDLKEIEMIGSSNYKSKRAPNSFLLFSTKRRHDLQPDGYKITTQQLMEEWKNMSKDQKAEFQNQSQCIQFTLDIDNRAPTTVNPRKKHPFIPKIVVPPPSSMVIPNDHSVDSSPISRDRDDDQDDPNEGYFMQNTSTYHLYDQPYQQQRQHQQHLSNLLLDSFHHNNNTNNNNAIHSPHPMYASTQHHQHHTQHHQDQRYYHHHTSHPPPHPSSSHMEHHYHHHQEQQQQQQNHYHHLMNDTSPIASPPTPYHFHQHRQLYSSNNSSSGSSQSYTATPPTHNGYTTNATSTKLIPNLSYSAAAEAAALESLSFNGEKEQHQQQQEPKQKSTAKSPIPSTLLITTSAASTTSQSTKRKYGILPEKVKRPPNAYLLFNRDMRRQLHDVNQGLSSGEISKSISQRWKQLSSIEKDFYFKEESKLKEQHKMGHDNFIYTRRSKAEMKQAGQMKKQQQQLQQQQQQQQRQQQQQQQQPQHDLQVQLPSPPSPQPPKLPVPMASTAIPIPKKQSNHKKKATSTTGRDPRGRKKKKPDDTLPKHPMSAYLHFAKEMRPIMKQRFPDARLVEISKEIGNEWRAMAQSDLQKWMDMANLDKARYAKQMKERIILGQQQENAIAANDDAQSFHSISSDHSSPIAIAASTRKRKFSSISSASTSNSTVTTSVMDDLDSDIIATVAQMVNPNALAAATTANQSGRG